MAGSKEILACRPSKDLVKPDMPYFWLHEEEPDHEGIIRSVNTIFLSNRECSFKCLMCDLWKKTLDNPTPVGAIPEQIRFALGQLPDASCVKLYNNGNFFDPKAIPNEDHNEICRLIRPFDHLVVENHPKLCNDTMLRFSEQIDSRFEIAMGLETVHPDVLPKLNKQMSIRDFERAANLLKQNGIHCRAFILFHPPFLTDPDENIHWALESIRFAFASGVDACSVIPVRTGNGIMEQLQKNGDYTPPTIAAFEALINEAHHLSPGRIFADVWDLERFSTCEECVHERKERLQTMNLHQTVLPAISCHCEYPI